MVGRGYHDLNYDIVENTRNFYVKLLGKMKCNDINDAERKNYYREKVTFCDRQLEIPQEVLMFNGSGEYENFNLFFFLNCKDEEDVFSFIRKENLNEEEIPRMNSQCDCTERLFGGRPIITKVCDNRYILRYSFSRDV